jgi:hypothetical protein
MPNNFNKWKWNQHYNHATELPDGFIGIEITGARQQDRALSLLGPDEERYFLDQQSLHRFLFWLPQSEVETTGEWVRTGRGKDPRKAK